MSQPDSKESRPPAKRIRLAEAVTPESGARRKLDFGMRDLRITDDDDDNPEKMQQVPVLASEKVKQAVCTVRPEGTDQIEDIKFQVSAVVETENSTGSKTVITEAFEGVTTSTVSSKIIFHKCWPRSVCNDFLSRCTPDQLFSLQALLIKE